MTITSWRRNLTVLVAISLTAVAWWSVGTRGGAQPNQGAKAKFLGVGRCMTCHLQPTARDATDFVLLTEYTTWCTLDKHSQAYAVLLGPRARQMEAILKTKVTEEKAGCLNCHSMNLHKDRAEPGRMFRLEDGVTCDGCHGPSEFWLEPHSKMSWRRRSATEKEELGMWNLRDPITRSAVCLSCHVGNVAEGKVVTHAMYAAGHPPLPPIEIETFCDHLPRHWRETKDVPFLRHLQEAASLTKPEESDNAAIKELTKVFKNEEFQTILDRYRFSAAPTARTRGALLGNVVAVRELMRLIADRADLNAMGFRLRRWPELAMGEPFELSDKPAERWPELAMAHSECFACHHELKSPAWRQVRNNRLPLAGADGLVGTPGRPQIRTWPLALGDFVLRQAESEDADRQAASTSYRDQLNAVYQVCNGRPFGAPDELSKAARQMESRMDRQLQDKLAKLPWKNQALLLLRQLCQLPAPELADFDTARQIASVIVMIHADWDPDYRKAPGLRTMLQELADDLNVRPYFGRAARLRLILQEMDEPTRKRLPNEAKLLAMLEETAHTEYKKKLTGDDLKAFQAFLNAMRDVGDEKLTKLMTDEKVKEELNRIGDEELAKSLDKVNRYDPNQFRKRLRMMAEFLQRVR